MIKAAPSSRCRTLVTAPNQRAGFCPLNAGARLRASAGKAGSTYTPRLPGLRLKNATTNTTHASRTTTSSLCLRISRMGRSSARNSSGSGNHSEGITLAR